MATFNLPENTPLRSKCMAGCDNITSVIVHDSNYSNRYTSIPFDAFTGCDNLESFEIDEDSALLSLASSNALLLSKDGRNLVAVAPNVTEIEIPYALGQPDYRCFTQCTTLETFTNDESNPHLVTQDGMLLFRESVIASTYTLYLVPNAAEACVIGQNTTSINPNAFANCNRLTAFVVNEHNSVYKSENNLLLKKGEGDTTTLLKVPMALSNITIPASVSAIEQGAFDDCLNIQSIAVAPANENLKVEDGMIMSADGTIIYHADNTITSVSIPDTVSEIKPSAFYGCDNLTSVVFPSNVTVIGENAFGDCHNITEVTISQGVCKSTLANVFPDSYTKITKVRFSGNITMFGINLFKGCTSLYDIAIPSTLIALNQGAFAQCTSLTTAVIPGTVRKIETSAFSGCTSLTDLTLNKNITRIGPSAFRECVSLSTITIPDTVTNIDSYAFYGCHGLQEVVLPPKLDTITAYAFADCPLLTLDIPHDIKEIGLAAFADSPNIVENLVLNKVTKIGAEAFYGCTHLKTVTISNPSAIVGDEDSKRSPFNECTGITTVTVPSDCVISNPYMEQKVSVESVPLLSYSRDPSIPRNRRDTYVAPSQMHITLPANCVGAIIDSNNQLQFLYAYSQSVIDRAFDMGCIVLLRPDPVQEYKPSRAGDPELLTAEQIAIRERVYEEATTKTIEIPEASWHTIKTTFPDAYDKITSVTVVTGATKIGIKAFADCSALTSVSLPDTIITLEKRAFQGCVNLPSIQLPNGLQTIEDSVFKDCDSITSLTIPATTTHIVFNGLENLNTIIVENGNPVYSSDESQKYVMTAGGTKLKYAVPTLTKVSIPLSVTELSNVVAGSQFKNNDHITEIEITPVLATLPQNVTDKYLNKSALSSFFPKSFTSISKITVSPQVTTLGDCLFANMTGLLSISLPNSITSMGKRTFYNCPSLTRIDIPDSVSSIGEYAFTGCSSLTYLKLSESLTAIPDFACQNCNSLTNLTLPSQISSIGKYAFENCSSLVSITAPTSCTKFGEGVFKGCSSAETISISNGTGTIPASFMEGCSSVSDFTVPTFVEKVGSRAFWGCSSLSSLAFTVHLKNVDGSAFVYAPVDISVSENNTTYKTENGLLLSKDGTKLVRWYSGAIFFTTTSFEKIGTYACAGHDDIVNIYIPDSISRIEAYAFFDCPNIQKFSCIESSSFINPLVLEEGFMEAGTALTTVSIERETDIPTRAFRNCGNLTSCSLSHVQSIGDYAFENCISLADISLNVVWIGVGAFMGCTSLVSFHTGAYIGSYGFANCTALVSALFLSGCGANAFLNCSALTSVTLIESGLVNGLPDKEAFNGCLNLTTITVPTTLEKDNLGEAYKTIKHIIIGDTYKNHLTQIGAWEKMPNLESVTIEGGIRTVAKWMFRDCPRLKSVSLPTSLINLNETAFEGCPAIEEATLPSLWLPGRWDPVLGFVDEDPDFPGQMKEVFPSSVATLKKVVINSASSRYLKHGAFEGCVSLQYVLLTPTITSVGHYAFKNCISLPSMPSLPNITEIGNYAFENCQSFEMITLLDSITSIGDGAFKGCLNLISATLPIQIDKISSELFSGCSSLVGMSARGQIKIIGKYAFEGCISLSSNFRLPDGIEELPEYCFKDCTSFSWMVIPDTISNINPLAFYGCSGLDEFIVSTANPVYASNNGWLLSKDETMLIVASTNRSLSELPSSVSAIGPSACRSHIMQIETMPSFIKTIHESAWEGNLTIEELDLGSVQRIKEKAFLKCSNLGRSGIVLPSSMLEVCKEAFGDCTSIFKLETNSDIPDFWYAAFRGCTALNEITLAKQTKLWREDAKGFSFYARNIHGYHQWYYDGQMPFDIYKKVYPNPTFDPARFVIEWKWNGNWYKSHLDFSLSALLCDMGNALTTITLKQGWTEPPEGMAGLESLTTVVLPNSITSLRDGCFSNCTHLTSVNIPEKVYYIPTSCFEGCISLPEISLPHNDITIGNQAFNGCTSLTHVDVSSNTSAFSYTTTTGYSDWHFGWDALSKVTYQIISEKPTEPDLYKFSLYMDGDIFGRPPIGSTTSTEPNPLILIFNVSYPGTSTPPGTILAIRATTSDGGRIGDYAFQNCTSLISLSSCFKANSVGKRAFLNCKELETFHYWGSPDGSVTISESAFENCSNLTTLDFPVTRGYIHDRAFYGCSGLTSVSLPNTFLFKFGSYVFSGCTSLHSIMLPSLNREIPTGTFQNCIALEASPLTSGMTSVGEKAFEGCSFTEVDIPASIKTLHATVFQNCKDITTITMNPGIATSMKAYFNAAYSKVSSFTIVNGSTTIPSNFFDGCSSLHNLTVPNSVVNMQTWGNVPLTELHISASSASLPFASMLPYTYTQLARLVITGGSNIIPLLCKGCAGLDNISLPEGLLTIGHHAFDGCASIESISMPDSVQSLEANVFYRCSGLLEFALGNSSALTAISDFAFEDCTALANVALGTSITTLGSGAFYKCAGLESLTLASSTKIAYSSLLLDGTGDTKPVLYVPANLVAEYSSDAKWTAAVSAIQPIEK